MRRRHDGVAGGAAGRRCPRRRYRQQPCRSREPARASRRPGELPVPGRRCHQSERARRRSFDLMVSIFGAMFAPKPFDVAREMVRVTRPGGRIVMGNWIPGDPTFVAQTPEDQLRVFAAAARGLCQPDDVGHREQRRRATSRRPDFQQRRSRARGTPTRSLSRSPRPRTWPTSGLLRPDDERVRRGGTDRQAAELQQELVALFERQNQSGTARRRFPRPSCASPSAFERVHNHNETVRPRRVRPAALSSTTVLERAVGHAIDAERAEPEVVAHRHGHGRAAIRSSRRAPRDLLHRHRRLFHQRHNPAARASSCPPPSSARHHTPARPQSCLR